ncbi:hypothetical protein I4F81_003700 [Pyropia yezoensis]|uniref:Uncharacterized protein n=1 Tax=Pyropia yezoensis TaxID=2788 RepID=A0ACC3BTT6_PYRYE|nr:hypothetical protein I4F81_003700 [Neopyropia yezoensis]
MMGTCRFPGNGHLRPCQGRPCGAPGERLSRASRRPRSGGHHHYCALSRAHRRKARTSHLLKGQPRVRSSKVGTKVGAQEITEERQRVCCPGKRREQASVPGWASDLQEASPPR